MIRVDFILIIFVTLLLNACGFNAFYKASAMNAAVISSPDNEFSHALKKHFNENAAKSFIIELGSENKKKRDNSYLLDGTVNSYELKLIIAVKVFDNSRQLLLSQDLTASINFSKIDLPQAEKAQIAENYAQLRTTIIKKLLLKLYELDVK